MTSYDLSPDSAAFMRAVTTGELDFKVAQDLLIAFMRLNQTRQKGEESSDTSTASADEEVENH